jgi:hypothetical protein
MRTGERDVAVALAYATFPPGTRQKRFAKNMIYHALHMPDKAITRKQSIYLFQLAIKYRSQIPGRAVIQAQIELAVYQQGSHNSAVTKTGNNDSLNKETPPQSSLFG